MLSSRKGAIWISAVLYVLIAVVIMVIVLEAGLPLIKSLNEKSSFTRIRDTLVGLDRQIQQVASEGQGSQRIIPLEVTDGEFRIEQQKIRWKLETDSKIVEPKTRIELGNLVVASGVDVTASNVGDFFIVENSRIRANFSRIGSASNYSSINTSAIINNVIFKDSSAQTAGTFTFFVNDSNSLAGNGYTSLEDAGSGLTSASVRAHVNNSAMAYDIVLTLDSKADFLRAAIENFARK